MCLVVCRDLSLNTRTTGALPWEDFLLLFALRMGWTSKTILSLMTTLQLEPCFELLRIDQEARNVDKVEAHSEEQGWLPLRLEHKLDARLVVISQVDQFSHAVEQAWH